jgi:hypothetical protein
MEKTISVDFTANEAQVILEIIDIAVRARGVAAAEAGLHLTRKIETKLKAAFPPANQVQTPELEQDNSFAPHIVKP